MREKDYFLKLVLADTRYNDNDMGTEAQWFYREYFSRFINCERGETWFTPIALLDGIGTRASQYERLCSEFDNSKEKVKSFKLRLMSSVSMKVIKRDIGRDYHALVNFGCHPSRLNWWKGFGNRWRLGDFPDLYFECVRQWFICRTDLTTTNFGYGKKEQIELDKQTEWFKMFGEGEKGWKEFADGMKLTGNFVNGDYTVRKLFNHEIGDPFPNLLTFKRKKYETLEELAKEISENEQVRECIDNIYNIWCSRAGLLAGSEVYASN